MPDKRHGNVYLYVSSYNPNAAFPDCLPPHDKISVIKVPLGDPDLGVCRRDPGRLPRRGQRAQPGLLLPNQRVSRHHRVPGEGHGRRRLYGRRRPVRHQGPAEPEVSTGRGTDPNFAFWHSATFNNAGTKVVFTDELGGGGAATCNEATGPNRGADAIYDIVGTAPQLVFKSYFKIPRYQADTENCVAHNGSLIPVRGRDIMVQAWYQGGVSIWDFTDSAHPAEIGYFERGPASEAVRRLLVGVLLQRPCLLQRHQQGPRRAEVDQDSIPEANTRHLTRLNVQTQPDYRDSTFKPDSGPVPAPGGRAQLVQLIGSW